MVEKFLRIVGNLWLCISATAFLLFFLFVCIKVPYERFYENPTFWEMTELSDGPHVFVENPPQIKILNIQGDGLQRKFLVSERLSSVEEGENILSLSAGSLTISESKSIRPSSYRAEKIAVVGDIHGKYRHLLKLLEGNRILDPQGNWAWGSHHLIFLGDVFDKGPGVTQCLWLIHKLELQADKANGKVHYLFGNHDHLALNNRSQTHHSKYLHIAEQTGLAHAELFNRSSFLGRWIRDKDLILKINDRLFMHAGLSQPLLQRKMSLESLNRLARKSFDADSRPLLSAEERTIAREIWGSDGPVWFRGYFDSSFPLGILGRARKVLREAAEVESLLDRTLQQYDCRQIVVGHTVSRRIQSFYHGKLIDTCLDLPGNDVPSTEPAGELLLIEKEKAYRASADGIRHSL